MKLQNTSDAFVRKTVEDNFAFITGERLPIDKGKNKNVDKGPKEWFAQLSFLHLMLFMNAFREAKARGILNPAEIVAGDEVMAIINA